MIAERMSDGGERVMDGGFWKRPSGAERNATTWGLDTGEASKGRGGGPRNKRWLSPWSSWAEREME